MTNRKKYIKMSLVYKLPIQ